MVTDKEHAEQIDAMAALLRANVETMPSARRVAALTRAVEVLRQWELVQAKARCWEEHEAVGLFSVDPDRRYGPGHLAASQRLSAAIKALEAKERGDANT